ncbi:MAG: DEAD/DEAH box helicase [Gammaproteobacteria bacterium]|nr:MAG: DEAD/DEAH box helicase [Gammaproteobacteria bacterium]
MSSPPFNAVVWDWFASAFAGPTPTQLRAWDAIRAGTHTLIAAPTGSGKTLAGFLCAIDGLVTAGLRRELRNEVYVLYVSPLKALSNDIHRNLELPLQGIDARFAAEGNSELQIRAAVRTGDTPAGDRERMRRRPPHILVTTPESLFILLTSASGRSMLASVRTVIVDEIHALVGNRRGSHLSLSLERLESLCARPPQRIGLSATQRPLATVARYLAGDRPIPCVEVDCGHVRDRDLALEIPDSPLSTVMSNEIWGEIYDRLAALVAQHTSTLIFVNTRRLAERAARQLAERLGADHVTAHHGSLAREHRLMAEQRLKQGGLKALVATASLELGIDIGHVDLVCQLGSPGSVTTFLQRVGRSGHTLGGLPKGRLFPLSRDDLLECTALLDAVRRDELEELTVPPGHLDVLAQQIIAEVACGERGVAELYECLRLAWPYRALKRADFDRIVTMLAEGFSTRRGRRGRYLYHDGVNERLRPRRSARLAAVTNAGAIPDQFEYVVVLEPEGHPIGTVTEDFAFESLPGDTFQLGNASYSILKIESGRLRVADAGDRPPNIPFWLGEAPGRSDLLSRAVSGLRDTLDSRLREDVEAAQHWLVTEIGLSPEATGQLCEYLAAARAALGRLPTQERIIFERFFDEAGDQHMVIHSPYGIRINRAWGLGLRKRFCRQFNFELQAAALEDSIVISLGATHSFPLEEATRYVSPGNVRHLVTQAMLAAPMFPTHWRWNANIALAVLRNTTRGRTPPQFQRADAEDLLAVVFPDQLACQENLQGEREIPSHPLVDQTVHDCLHEVMDIDGLETLLERCATGAVEISCRELNSPSPLAQGILNARPYAFLDDAPLEERRTQNVQARRYLDPAEAAALGSLGEEAIAAVRAEAWPVVESADDLHDALLMLGFMTVAEAGGDNPLHQDGRPWLDELIRGRRATCLDTGQQRLLVCAERLRQCLAVFSSAHLDPPIPPAPQTEDRTWERDQALVELIRARLEGVGPVTAEELVQRLETPIGPVQAALLWLQNEGYAMQGRFAPGATDQQWCERGLLARMHRYTIKDLRAATQAVATADYLRFLVRWQHLEEPLEGEAGLAAVLYQLEGFSIPAALWEREVLPARVRGYLSLYLDNLCGSGQVSWLRLHREQAGSGKSGLLRNTPIALLGRAGLECWRGAPPEEILLTSNAERIHALLLEEGAMFFSDLVRRTGLLRTHVEGALAELSARGLATSDNFAGLRALIIPAAKKRSERPRPYYAARRHDAFAGIDRAGRWSLIRGPVPQSVPAGGWLSRDLESLEQIGWVLLHRYGVVFRAALAREHGLPPWRDLLYVYRRFEARGEIRGGRFVAGWSGEQFALPEAVPLLRRQSRTENLPDIAISAADPLNLTGILLPGERIPAISGNRILLRNGLPVAMRTRREIRYLREFDNVEQIDIRERLSKY